MIHARLSPALILHADEDPIFSLEHGVDMAERIPHATLTVLEGAGHNHRSLCNRSSRGNSSSSPQAPGGEDLEAAAMFHRSNSRP